MEHKDYKLEILLELLKSPCHMRGIAKNLNTNHMNIIRKMKELAKENAVDYKEEGKNKVYFLKKTTEAKTLAFMAEHYKLLKILKRYPELRSTIEAIQKKKEIKLAILFGSYVKELVNGCSDIDLYIETTNHKLKKEIGLINTKLSIKIGKYDTSNLLIKEINKNHVIIEGVEKYYELNRFFE